MLCQSWILVEAGLLSLPVQCPLATPMCGTLKDLFCSWSYWLGTISSTEWTFLSACAFWSVLSCLRRRYFWIGLPIFHKVQYSDAFEVWCMASSMIALLQIYRRLWQWKNSNTFLYFLLKKNCFFISKVALKFTRTPCVKNTHAVFCDFRKRGPILIFLSLCIRDELQIKLE